VSAIRVGDSSSAVGNGLVVTNGGYVKASTTYVAGYYGGNRNYVIVTGADSAGRPATLEGNLCLVGTSASGVGNWVRVGAGGLVTNGQVVVGSVANACGNSLAITNGGQIFSKTAGSIGNAAGANSNQVVIAGQNGATNSVWNLGGTGVTNGGNASAMGNRLTVDAGGVLSNGVVVMGGAGSVFAVGGVADLSGVTMGGAGSQLAMNNGCLRVPALTIGTNAALSGTGCINASVTIQGKLVRGSGGGLLTVSNSLTLSGTAVLQAAFGATGDVVAVTGTLTLDGTINITDAGGFAPGVYVLFTYPAGSLVNNGMTIGTVPDGSYGYSVDTSLAGYVRLVVARPTYTSWLTNYPGVGAWDGDPDGDGEKTLMEYALKRNPTVKDKGGFALSRDSNSLPTVVYTRRLPPRDVSYWIERCGDLKTGGWDTNEFLEIRAVNDGNGLTETVTVGDGAPVTNTIPRFYRLKVSQP